MERKVQIAKLLQESGLTVSMSNGRRIIAQGAVRLNGVPKTDMTEEVTVRAGDVLQAGRTSVTLTE